MAEMSLDGLDDLMLTLQEIAEIPDDVQDEILNAQADVVVAAQKQTGEAMGVRAAVGGGQMLNSIGKTKVKLSHGQRVIYVTPKNSRKRGKTTTRNAEIAFINNYGKKSVAARPFISSANEQTAERQTAAALAVYNKFLESKKL